MVRTLRFLPSIRLTTSQTHRVRATWTCKEHPLLPPSFFNFSAGSLPSPNPSASLPKPQIVHYTPRDLEPMFTASDLIAFDTTLRNKNLPAPGEDRKALVRVEEGDEGMTRWKTRNAFLGAHDQPILRMCMTCRKMDLITNRSRCAFAFLFLVAPRSSRRLMGLSGAGSGCKMIFYCSPKCQREHWPEHKIDCARRRRRSEGQEFERWTPSPLVLCTTLYARLHVHYMCLVFCRHARRGEFPRFASPTLSSSSHSPRFPLSPLAPRASRAPLRFASHSSLTCPRSRCPSTSPPSPRSRARIASGTCPCSSATSLSSRSNFSIASCEWVSLIRGTREAWRLRDDAVAGGVSRRRRRRVYNFCRSLNLVTKSVNDDVADAKARSSRSFGVMECTVEMQFGGSRGNLTPYPDDMHERMWCLIRLVMLTLRMSPEEKDMGWTPILYFWEVSRFLRPLGVLDLALTCPRCLDS